MHYGSILLISDGSQIFPALTQFLTGEGYQVTATCVTQEAFQALRTGNFPLVITCLSNDWPDTRPFIKAVRDLNREIAVIILRVGPVNNSPLDAYLIKEDSYQSLPCGWGGLKSLVADCLDGYVLASESG
jgi:DNA-binding NtrC family response regulator